mmetsp:Transcript_95633/g.243065  ORF Transcript_95633/g.243065 Transcript_95633/m.243065 type:complete len:210 (+) Transcript_95633:581-1210(+)
MSLDVILAIRQRHHARSDEGIAVEGGGGRSGHPRRIVGLVALRQACLDLGRQVLHKARRVHAERSEDVLLQILVECHARQHFDNAANDVNTQGVLPNNARLVDQGQSCQASRYLFQRFLCPQLAHLFGERVRPAIAQHWDKAVRTQACRVCEQVSHQNGSLQGHNLTVCARHTWNIGKLWYKLCNAVVQAPLAFLVKLHRGNRRQELGA